MEKWNAVALRIGAIDVGIASLMLYVGALQGADGVLYYNSVPNQNAPAQLRRINGDGTADQLLSVALKEAAFPTASRDGQRLLITSTDPDRPFKLSQNVYSLDLVSGQISKVTAFEDFVRTRSGEFLVKPNGVLEHPDDPVVSAYTTHLPNYKAYAPDGSRVAVMNFSATSGTLLGTDSTLQRFSASTPSLALHIVGNPQPLGTSLQQGAERTGANHGGEGVDWHPNLEEVVAAFRTDIPVTGSGGITMSEGTFLAVFSTDGRAKPFLRKLTSPSGVWDTFFLDDFTFFTTTALQNDYAPAISPDGQRVAYVRNTLRFDSRVSLFNLPCQCVIRIVQYDGTGDREVLAFPDGAFVSRLTWSPDGNEIAFDTAPQLPFQADQFYLLGDSAKSEIGVVRSDGTSRRTLVGAPASSPSWTVGEPAVPPLKPSFQVARIGAELLFQIGNLPVGRQVEIETTTNFEQWTSAQKFQSSSRDQTARLAFSTTLGKAFFRIAIR